MFKITFKNVGQGDSIILEWGKNQEDKIAIIDCNLTENNQNPVLTYLQQQQNKFKEIEFILLTHPHYDHFSGMRKLLEYCEKTQIIIKKFLHTSFQNPEYLTAATKSDIAQNELFQLFKKAKELRYKSNIIEYESFVTNDNSDLPLSDDLKLRFLAPSTVEFDKYIVNTNIFSDEESPHNNANANWLSTVIKIFTPDWYILLTSDCEKAVLKHLGIKKDYEFSSTLLLGQSPHHGALGNHNSSFWKLKKRNGKTPIVFSVGRNGYNHPSSESVKTFEKNDYKIHSTNKVGSLLSFDTAKAINEINALLDLSGVMIYEDATNSFLAGDQTFLIGKGNIQYIPS